MFSTVKVLALVQVLVAVVPVAADRFGIGERAPDPRSITVDPHSVCFDIKERKLSFHVRTDARSIKEEVEHVL